MTGLLFIVEILASDIVVVQTQIGPTVGRLQVRFLPCLPMCPSVLGRDADPYIASGGYRLAAVQCCLVCV